MEEDAGGYCDVYGLDRGGEGDRHETAHPLTHVRRQTGALVSNRNGEPKWKGPVGQCLTPRIRAP